MYYSQYSAISICCSAGPVYKYDLSLPLSELYSIVEKMRERLKDHGEAVVVAYGHMGDGNVHVNVSVPQYSDTILKIIEPFVYEYTAKHKGSISAEHGERLSQPQGSVRSGREEAITWFSCYKILKCHALSLRKTEGLETGKQRKVGRCDKICVCGQ